VTAVDNGEKAINLIRENEYKLVLTDLVMRGINGLTPGKQLISYFIPKNCK